MKPHQTKSERWNLSAIDLPQMMSVLGGTVTVNVFNAYISYQANTLLTSDVSCLHTNLILKNFSKVDTSEANQDITIRFGDDIFKALREYWNKITSDEFLHSIYIINNKSEKELAKQAIKAILIVSIYQIKFRINDQIALFSPPSRIWKFDEQSNFNQEKLNSSIKKKEYK